MCYSDTTAALDRMGTCGYLIQRAGKSFMLPASVPHAALPLTSQMLNDETFHVREAPGTRPYLGWNKSASHVK
jgi:hypothetical protein